MELGRLQKILIGLGVLMLVGVGAAYFLREPLRGFVNGIRAERMAERAEAAFEGEQWAEAVRLGQAAHYLAPEDLGIQLLVARGLLQQRNASAVDWWRRVLEEPDLPVEELRQVTAALLAGENAAEALPFLNRLVELDADSPETRRLWLQSLQRQRRYGMARDLASRFAEGGTEDWGIHRAYLAFQRGDANGEARARIVEHLGELLEAENALSLNAARELVVIESADHGLREQAAAHLEAEGEDALDRLYARSFAVKEGDGERADLEPLLEEILAAPEEGFVDELLDWARWMNATDWFIANVDWETYRESGGAADPYFDVLLEAGETDRILRLTEDLTSETGATAAAFLYYRSLALEATGEPERARQTLELSVQTTEPESGEVLERYLIRGQHWELLDRLYLRLLAEDPDDELLLFKRLASRYYNGDQGALPSILEQLERGDFETRPDLEGFFAYIHLLIDGYSPPLHQHLEDLIGRYPEVFDFRLILGLSYALQGQVTVARSLAENMPELGLGAPRYLRVAAIVLGRPAEDLIAPGERDRLLPRERYLLSRSRAESTP